MTIISNDPWHFPRTELAKQMNHTGSVGDHFS